MRSLLISTDLIRKGDGNWTPTEINTNSGHDIDIPQKSTAAEFFIENFDTYLEHLNFHNFLQENGITKMIVIDDRNGGLSTILNSFANYYQYEFTNVDSPDGSITVPYVEDVEDTIIIRIAYDTTALVDDLYTRDMFEFHNLIKDESFASPVTFNTGEENNIDTIVTFEPSIDGIAPNYLVKPRVPGYVKGMYPRVYRLDTQEELDELKASLTENQFIQKYEYNEEAGTINNRTFFVRSLDLLYGSNLDVLNIGGYKSINGVSVNNTLLRYDTELVEGKRLNQLVTTKWHPVHTLSNSLRYHFDATDFVLMPDGTDKLASELVIDEAVFGINFNEEIQLHKAASVTTLSTFTTGSTNVSFLEQNPFDCIYINITAVDENNNEYSWSDGVGNSYLVQKSGTTDAQYISEFSGIIEIGDIIFIFNKTENVTKPLTVTDVFFDIKNIPTYTISLEQEFREFLIKLDGDLYLLQHNAACNANCGVYYFCGSETCALCNKNSQTCPYCTNDGSTFICNQGV